jgi:hypothetical protein
MQTRTCPDVVADIPDVPVDVSTRRLLEGSANVALLLGKAPKVDRR